LRGVENFLANSLDCCVIVLVGAVTAN